MVSLLLHCPLCSYIGSASPWKQNSAAMSVMVGASLLIAEVLALKNATIGWRAGRRGGWGIAGLHM